MQKKRFKSKCYFIGKDAYKNIFCLPQGVSLHVNLPYDEPRKQEIFYNCIVTPRLAKCQAKSSESLAMKSSMVLADVDVYLPALPTWNWLALLESIKTHGIEFGVHQMKHILSQLTTALPRTVSERVLAKQNHFQFRLKQSKGIIVMQSSNGL